VRRCADGAVVWAASQSSPPEVQAADRRVIWFVYEFIYERFLSLVTFDHAFTRNIDFLPSLR
jgi:hypothetical protein